MRKFILSNLLLAISTGLFAQLPSEKIDSIANAALAAFDVPGIAVGVVKDGKIIHAKGYGVRSLTNKLLIDDNTLFGIASNSKGFTAIALGILADEGKLNWDDKVRKFIPEFTLYDAYVSESFTIKDLLTHRSGLPLGAGDLMFFPEGGNISVPEIIHNLRYLKPSDPFRNKFMYNNNLYIVAGEVIKRISGMEWAEFIEKRIMQPVGMTNSFGSYNRAKDFTNKIDAHAPVNGKAIAIPHDWSETANAAGGIMSNITDLAKWVTVLMNGSEYAPGKKLLKPSTLNQIWNLQTPMPVAPNNTYNTHFSGYGLGYFLNDVKGGYLQVSHTGGLLGTVTQITMLPELKLGIIVLTNQQSGFAFNSITNSIKDSYLGYPNRNWIKTYIGRNEAGWKEANKITDSVSKLILATEKSKSFCIKNSQVIGTYKDDWMGNINVAEQGGKLKISFERSARLSGDLLPLANNTYVARWSDRSYDADAYVTFSLNTEGKATSFKMEALSPMTDFSFDFHDLEPKRK